MHKPKLPLVAHLVVFALALPLAACSESNPAGPSNDGLNQTQLVISQAYQKFFTQNDGLASFNEFSSYMGDALPAASIAPDLLSSLDASPNGLAGILRGSVAAFSAERLAGLAEAAAIPVAVLGTTFTYDPINGYQPDASREGAPTNGVRFILYDDPNILNEIGYLDVIDESDFSAVPPTVDVSLAIVVSEQTVVSYNIAGTGTEASVDLLATGFLSDGTDQLNFSIDLVGSSTGGSEADFTLTFGDASINLILTDEASGAEALTATIDDSDNVVVMTIAADGNGTVVDGSEVTLNGIAVAQFSGNADNISITDPYGNPLSNQDRNAIAQLFGAVAGAALFMLQLMVVGIGLIGLAFV